MKTSAPEAAASCACGRPAVPAALAALAFGRPASEAARCLSCATAAQAPCVVCERTAAVWPLAVRALAPDGRTHERGARVCLACVCTLTDAPTTTPTAAYLVARRRYPGGGA